jgi:hypothetical protein
MIILLANGHYIFFYDEDDDFYIHLTRLVL